MFVEKLIKEAPGLCCFKSLLKCDFLANSLILLAITFFKGWAMVNQWSFLFFNNSLDSFDNDVGCKHDYVII